MLAPTSSIRKAISSSATVSAAKISNRRPASAQGRNAAGEDGCTAMTQPSGSSAQLDRDTIEYGPISGWAFVAVFLGLLSGAGVAGPILWFIPLVAIVISLIAMRKIAASAGQLSGW